MVAAILIGGHYDGKIVPNVVTQRRCAMTLLDTTDRGYVMTLRIDGFPEIRLPVERIEQRHDGGITLIIPEDAHNAAMDELHGKVLAQIDHLMTIIGDTVDHPMAASLQKLADWVDAYERLRWPIDEPAAREVRDE